MNMSENMSEKIERLLALDWDEEVLTRMGSRLQYQVFEEMVPCSNRVFLERYLELDKNFDIKK
jgi:hypothetical protein